MRSTTRAHRLEWIFALVIIVFAVSAKFLWPLFVFDAPIGFDAGIYRYLFLRHAEGFPPFVLAPMDLWAKEHPLGLFVFSSPLIRLGVPVDWLIGWIWNVFCIGLCAALWWAVRPTFGKKVALWALLAAALSIALSYGFFAMYWKTYASLFWMLIAYRGFDRKAWWTPIPAILAIATHHQTGLLLGLVVLSTAVLIAARLCSAPGKQDRRLPFGRMVIAGTVIAAVGLLFYAPIWKHAVMGNLGLLLQIGGTAPAGSFPPVQYFLVWSLPLLALGGIGFAASLRKIPFGIWHLSVLWPLFLVIVGAVFRNRFWLHAEFFLLPFAGYGIAWLWSKKTIWTSLLVILAVSAQAWATVAAAGPWPNRCAIAPWICSMQTAYNVRPSIQAQAVVILEQLRSALPADATILVLDPESTPVVRGWLTEQHVSGPGVFQSPFGYDGWEKVILGTDADRRLLLQAVPRPLFFYASRLFYDHYKDAATLPFDPCIQKSNWAELLSWNC